MGKRSKYRVRIDSDKVRIIDKKFDDEDLIGEAFEDLRRKMK